MAFSERTSNIKLDLWRREMLQPAKRAAVGLETILVVDDDPEWCDYYCRVVGRKYPVISTCWGCKVLRIASHTDTKVIILDVMMSDGKDGFAIFSELKECPQTRGIPVIMVSDVNQRMDLKFSSDNMQEYLGKAPFAFLEKPVRPDVLMKKVEMAISYGGKQS